MVVNGTTWPNLEVAPALYRFRLLNGCNSRFLNLSLKSVDPASGKPISVKRTEWVTQKNGKLKANKDSLGNYPFTRSAPSRASCHVSSWWRPVLPPPAG